LPSYFTVQMREVSGREDMEILIGMTQEVTHVKIVLLCVYFCPLTRYESPDYQRKRFRNDDRSAPEESKKAPDSDPAVLAMFPCYMPWPLIMPLWTGDIHKTFDISFTGEES